MHREGHKDTTASSHGVFVRGGRGVGMTGGGRGVGGGRGKRGQEREERRERRGEAGRRGEAEIKRRKVE